MTLNKLIKLKLESRTDDLKAQGKTEREMAAILSSETNQKITKACVHRYLASQTEQHKELIQKKEELHTRVIEAELDTVQARHDIIKELRCLARKAEEEGDLKTAITGLNNAVAALESLDKRLGKLTPQAVEASGVQVIFYLPSSGRGDKTNDMKVIDIGKNRD